ncbi:MAG TPA: M67 family metallopeptidase [Rhizomicrobium sp.]|nr:M67 family metallopeptidase [Rhizomicrobium sp.]
MAHLVMPPVLAEQILAQARAAYPAECCGLLEGVRADGGFRVAALHPARNLSDRPDRFAMDPRDQFAAQKAARANSHAIIGCYHSHPDGAAQPSAHDLAGAGEEDFLWLIAAKDVLGAFVYREGGFLGCITGADCVMSSE